MSKVQYRLRIPGRVAKAAVSIAHAIRGHDGEVKELEKFPVFAQIPAEWLEEVFFCAECGEEIDCPNDFIHNQYLRKNYHEKCWKLKVIPAEPKVLTADVSRAENYGDVINTELRESYIKGFSSGNRNGQLKRDMDYKELVKEVALFLAAYPADAGELHEALVNLKPLK